MTATATPKPLQGATLGSLAGKTVLVTGASRGIGAACAIACAQAGAARGILIARSPTRMLETARDLSRYGTSVASHDCDITDTRSLQRIIGQLDRLDVLVNCAGANQPEPFTEVHQDTFDRLWQLNVRAAFFAAQAAARLMISTGGGGVIVNMSSQMGHVGAPLRSVYCTTKHAVEGMTKALAVELAPHNIRVVSVAPTFVRTELTASQLDDPVIGGALLDQIPIGRFVTPEEVAAAVVFAASDAAGALTGSSLIIDGGWTAK